MYLYYSFQGSANFWTMHEQEQELRGPFLLLLTVFSLLEHLQISHSKADEKQSVDEKISDVGLEDSPEEADVDVEGRVGSEDTHDLQVHQRVEVRHQLPGGVALLPLRPRQDEDQQPPTAIIVIVICYLD